jgi:hypothetical protein
MLMAVVCTAFSQSKFKKFYLRADSLLRERYERVTYDTQYICRPDRRFLFRIRANLSGTSIRYKNVTDGYDSHAHVSTDPRGTLSFGASYMGLAASFALNPAKMTGRNKDYELTVSASSNRYIIDFEYQRSNTLSGDITTKNRMWQVDKNFLKMKLMNLTACYIFNHRKFSYPAAFTQSYFQKRSAGSWLAGFSLMGGNVHTNDDAPAEAPDIHLKVFNISIGGGYGYNLVCRNWLFHLTAMPTIIVYNYNNISIEGVEMEEFTHFPDLLINCRAAIIYNISPRYFIGTSLVVNSSTLGNFNHYTFQTKWRGRLFFGFRL